jgi:hypothetical protein
MGNEKTDIDPRGVIYESYRMEGITPGDCRSIFLDWALGVPLGTDTAPMISALLDHYAPENPDHPMTATLQAGLEQAKPARRRGGRASRVSE